MKISSFISVVISFRNEGNVLPELINRLREVLSKESSFSYELIFVNDDSTDNSFELLMKYRQDDRNIKIINMSRRFGVSPCIMSGFRYAKGDAVIYMDADLQDPPELIPILLQKWKEGADVVNTIRTKRKGESVFKIWLTKQAYRLIRFLSEIDIPINAGDFKLLSRRVVDKIVQFNEYDPFLRGLVRWVGFKQAQVFYERQSRFAGKTHFSLWRSTNPIKEFIRGITSFSVLPLYFILISGCVIFTAALFYLIYLIIIKLMGINLLEYSVIVITMLFLGGMILCAIGILGIYIGRIYYDVKRRPACIIDSSIGFEEG